MSEPVASEPVVYLEVIALRGTFRRAGFVFDQKAKVIECSPAQAERIRAEDGKSLKVRNAKPGDAPVEVTLASLDDRISSLSAENAAIARANSAARDRITELEALLADARKGCDDLALKLADVREDNARLTAELSEATAPKSPEAPASKPAPAGKPSK